MAIITKNGAKISENKNLLSYNFPNKLYRLKTYKKETKVIVILKYKYQALKIVKAIGEKPLLDAKMSKIVVNKVTIIERKKNLLFLELNCFR